MFVRTLGHRVLADWMAREVKLKLKFEEPEVFPLAEDHLILRFKNDCDYALARMGGPWFVAGQLLPMEP